MDGPRQFIINNENGLLVPVNDSSKIEEAIYRIIENPEEADRFSRNANEMRYQFTIEKIAKQWQEIIKLIVERK